MQISTDTMFAVLDIHAELYYAYTVSSNELDFEPTKLETDSVDDEIKTPARLDEKEIGKILSKYGIDSDLDVFMTEFEEIIPEDYTLNCDVNGYFYS